MFSSAIELTESAGPASQLLAQSLLLQGGVSAHQTMFVVSFRRRRRIDVNYLHRGNDMKSVLTVAACAAVLLTTPIAAYSQDAPQAPSSTSNQWSAQQHAAPT